VWCGNQHLCREGANDRDLDLRVGVPKGMIDMCLDPSSDTHVLDSTVGRPKNLACVWTIRQAVTICTVSASVVRDPAETGVDPVW